MNQTKTRETIEYEKASKTVYDLYLKSELSKEGIDTSKVPRKVLDDIKRLSDKKGIVHQKYQAIITNIQQEASVAITKAQQEMQAEFADIQKDAEEIIKSIKIEQGIIGTSPEIPQTQPEPEKESTDEEVKKEPDAGEPQGDEK